MAELDTDRDLTSSSLSALEQILANRLSPSQSRKPAEIFPSILGGEEQIRGRLDLLSRGSSVQLDFREKRTSELAQMLSHHAALDKIERELSAEHSELVISSDHD